MAGVQLVKVTKNFGSVVAVDDFSLDIADKEFMVLLGPSGCGKSTVLRMIAGLEAPTSGEVFIGDQLMNGVAPKDRDVAMVFQSYALYPHKTVRANIEFPLKARGVDSKLRVAAVADATAVLGLADLLDRKPGQLSGGQRQRVALARALVRDPQVFCMDEPLSNLDAKLRGETRSELVALHQRLGSTFVYVTHDQVEAMTMGSRIAVIVAGVLQQVGSPTDVYDRPANIFVATFLGTPPMNIFPAQLFEAGEHSVGVRPEHMRFVDSHSGGVEATIRLVEHLGHEVHVTGVLADGTVVVARHGGEEASPQSGDMVTVSAEARHRHRFDVSGRRLA